MSKHSLYNTGKKDIEEDIKRSLSEMEAYKLEWERLAQVLLNTHNVQYKEKILDDMRFLESLIAGTPKISKELPNGGEREIAAWRTKNDIVGKEIQQLTRDKYRGILKIKRKKDLLDKVEVMDEYEGIHLLVQKRVEECTNARDYSAEFQVDFDHVVYQYAHEQVYLGKLEILLEKFRRTFSIAGVLEPGEQLGEFFVKKVYEVKSLKD